MSNESDGRNGTTITVYVDAATRAKVDALAEACGLSRSRLLCELIHQAQVTPLHISFKEPTVQSQPPCQKLVLRGLSAQELMGRSVDEMGLWTRAENALRAANIRTIGDLVQTDPSKLLRWRNFGRKSLANISEGLERLGLRFGMEVSQSRANR